MNTLSIKKHAGVVMALFLSLAITACTSASNTVPQPNDVSPSHADLIQVQSLTPDALVTSPLVIEGAARGPWYFEATFPVRLIDENGTELAQAIAQANGDWMTESFVPFQATLNFNPGTAKRGTVIIQNANASGLPEHAKEIRIPVRFE